MLHENGYFRVLDGGAFDLSFPCPGCGCSHGFNKKWTLAWNNGKPTISPSILVRHGRYHEDDSYEKIVCHLFIRDGKIQYLSDCTHALAGKTVDMEKEI